MLFDPVTTYIRGWEPARGRVHSHTRMPAEPNAHDAWLGETTRTIAHRVGSYCQKHHLDPTGVAIHLEVDPSDGTVQLDMVFPGATPLTCRQTLRNVAEHHLAELLLGAASAS